MTRDGRKGANEDWFREVNERLEQRAAAQARPADPFEIVCECAREDCTDRITISLAAYETVRKNPVAFILKPGHVDPACERATSSTAGYEIVEKFGDAGAVAESENPRDSKEAQ